MLLRNLQWFTIMYVIALTLLLELPSVPQEVNPIGQSPVKEYAHLITFALLGFLVELSRCKRPILFWVGVLLLYSLGTEVLQWLLNSLCYRVFDLQDLVQDVLGVLFGIFIGYCCRLFFVPPPSCKQ